MGFSGGRRALSGVIVFRVRCKTFQGRAYMRVLVGLLENY
jgi:hypothetical protein